jgi:hypothetical protein
VSDIVARRSTRDQGDAGYRGGGECRDDPERADARSVERRQPPGPIT